jgi:SAM-dependent methyltransferase
MKTHRKSPNPDLETIIPILIGGWRRLHQLPGPPDVLQTREFRGVVAAVKALQQKFLDGKSLVGQDYFNDPHLLGAHLLYQWILHYLEGLSLIGELPSSPKRVLDICSGAAPFSFAALRHGAHETIAIDRNSAALNLGGEICGRYGLPLTIRKWHCGKDPFPVEGKFDLIVLGYCLEELFPPSKKGWEQEQSDFLRILIETRLTDRGYLMIVDDSHNESNRRVLRLRDILAASGVPIQAPCVWRGECPALKTQNSPCYAQREFEKPYMIKEIQRAASINLSSLKMSYLIVRNPSAGWPTLPDGNLYRVISPPVESFGGKRFYLCGIDGKKNLGSRLAEHPVESRPFEFLRRGELISVSGALEKQNALDIIEGTTIRIEAACAKPLPERNEDIRPRSS